MSTWLYSGSLGLYLPSHPYLRTNLSWVFLRFTSLFLSLRFVVKKNLLKTIFTLFSLLCPRPFPTPRFTPKVNISTLYIVFTHDYLSRSYFSRDYCVLSLPYWWAIYPTYLSPTHGYLETHLFKYHSARFYRQISLGRGTHIHTSSVSLSKLGPTVKRSTPIVSLFPCSGTYITTWCLTFNPFPPGLCPSSVTFRPPNDLPAERPRLLNGFTLLIFSQPVSHPPKCDSNGSRVSWAYQCLK